MLPTILIGVDEAGYGPNLGAAAGFRVGLAIGDSRPHGLVRQPGGRMWPRVAKAKSSS